MKIFISEHSNAAIYEQIEQQIKDAILRQELKAEEPLPSIRGLAKDLQISVITTKRAYEELEEQGLIYSVPGRGFFVSSRKLEMLKEKKIQDIEKHMSELIKECKSAELSKHNMMDMLELLYDEEQ
ncbi:MAG: GntR family transcriptional regulator [Lachnospiraceae bacterium]|nr:GntR family transcriptional regulator [Lachnospiraceae bacterium]